MLNPSQKHCIGFVESAKMAHIYMVINVPRLFYEILGCFVQY